MCGRIRNFFSFFFGELFLLKSYQDNVIYIFGI